MRGEDPHFRAAHETAGVITRPRHKRDLETAWRSDGDLCWIL
jgi:hypothetical protein